MIEFLIGFILGFMFSKFYIWVKFIGLVLKWIKKEIIDPIKSESRVIRSPDRREKERYKRRKRK